MQEFFKRIRVHHSREKLIFINPKKLKGDANMLKIAVSCRGPETFVSGIFPT
jgi:hypothetical protein